MRHSLTKLSRAKRTSAPHQAAGFTIVELIVVILVLGLLTGLLFGPLDDLWTSNNRTIKSIVQFGDTRNTLRSIQQQVLTSNTFLDNNSVSDPENGLGLNWAGTDANHRRLILSGYATTTDGTGTQSVLLADVACAPVLNNYVYFISSGTLYRRTITSRGLVSACAGGDWDQNQSCRAGFSNTRCRAADAKLVANVTQFSTDYYDNSNNPLSGPTGAQSVTITLTTKVGSENSTSKMRMTRTSGS